MAGCDVTQHDEPRPLPHAWPEPPPRHPFEQGGGDDPTYGGSCHLRTLAGGRLEVLRADPRIRIAAPVLAEIRAGSHPSATIGHAHDGAEVLTIAGSNRTVIYRVGAHDAMTDTYRAEWPD